MFVPNRGPLTYLRKITGKQKHNGETHKIIIIIIIIIIIKEQR